MQVKHHSTLDLTKSRQHLHRGHALVVPVTVVEDALLIVIVIVIVIGIVIVIAIAIGNIWIDAA